jgi:SAM-dependent methyltransferase
VIPIIKKVVNKLTGMNTSISTRGTIPKGLTNTQRMFLRWNAERLNISLQESQNRYFTSWSAIRDGHGGSDYRTFSDLSHNIFQVFSNDEEEEVYAAYEFHGPTHFLRMLSYPEAHWNENDLIVQQLSNCSTVDIIDYGCGLAHNSRTLAKYLKDKGIKTKLILIDIPTIRKGFLLWLRKQTDIETTFLDCTATSPMPDLPKCDICFATEFFEHVYEPTCYFDHIHAALKVNGLLVTSISDHKKEFMHVTPNLHALREKIQSMGYIELKQNQVFKKIAIDETPEKLS